MTRTRRVIGWIVWMVCAATLCAGCMTDGQVESGAEVGMVPEVTEGAVEHTEPVRRAVVKGSVAPVGGAPLDGQAADPVAEQAGGADSPSAELPVGSAPVDAANRPPRLSTVGPWGVVPERLQLEFDYTVALPGLGEPGAGTVIVMEPQVQGAWRYSSPSVLAFYPANPLPPGTDISIRVEALEVPSNVLRGGVVFTDPQDVAQVVTPARAWELSTRTPAFVLQGMTASRDDASRVVVAEMNFSAPVASTAVHTYVNWELDGRPPIKVVYNQGSVAHQVMAHLTLPRGMTRPTTLKLDLEAGLPYDDGVSAPAKEVTVHIEAGGLMEVVGARLQEGPDSYYIEFTCHDAAVRDTRYDYNVRKRISSRCDVDAASALQAVEIHPRAAFQVSPSTRGVNLTGNFKQGSYTVRFRAGLRTDEGSILRETFERTFDIPALTPTVDFSSKGRYLPRTAWNDLTIRHRNLSEVDLTVRHVPAQNLAFWMSSPNEAADARTSDVAFRTKLLLENKPDQQLTTTLPIEDLLGEPEMGIYQIEVGGRGAKDVARLLVTDINLVVKRASGRRGGEDSPVSDAVDVWAIHMQTLQPLQGANIEAVRPSGATITACTTDKTGHCRLTFPDAPTDKTPPFAILATRGDDVTYLKYDELRTELARGETHGAPYIDESVYKGYIYGDRDLYRPAEMVHLIGVVRNADMSGAAPEMPVELELTDPRGQVVQSTVLKTNGAGMFEHEHRLSDIATTGTWRAKLEIGKNTVATYTFSVEEFVPERLRADASPASEHFAIDEPATINVSARYLFGASAVGSPVELQCQIEPATFAPQKNAEFRYGTLDLNNDEPTASVTLPTRTSEIDEHDKAEVACGPMGSQAKFSGTGRLSATIAVSEAGSGRTTMARARATIHPERHYVGLRSDKDKLIDGESFRVEGVIVDWTGEVVSTVEEVEVEYISLQPQWGRFFDNRTGRATYRSYFRMGVERTERVAVKDGRFRLDSAAGTASRGYLVRVKAGNTQTELRFEATYTGWWRSSSNQRRDITPRPMRPGAVDIEPPKFVSLSGPQALQFTAPFKGRALLTLETNEVLHHEWIDVNPGPQSWSFDFKKHAPKTYAPNVYATVLVVKDPHLESRDAFMPERAFGAVSIPVERTEYAQTIKLTVPDEIRPDSKLKVRLDVGAGRQGEQRFATVAAVDEGILRITRYRAPDPLDEFFKRRALAVATFDTIGWSVQMPVAGPSGRTGGGDEDDDGRAAAAPGRIMPIEPVALWSGIVAIPASGKLDVELDVPLYRGDLRVMAVVVGKKEIGTAESNVLIRDPLSVQATFPRFLTVTDEVKIPVFVSNMTDKNRRVQVQLSARQLDEPGLMEHPESAPIIGIKGASINREGGMGESRQFIDIEAGQSGTVVFTASALRAGGAAVFDVTASSDELLSRAEGTVPFRAAGPRERKVIKMPILTSSVDLKPYLEGWVATSEHTNIWVTPIPHAEAFDHLSYLIRYPFGCVEQTTSTTRPLLFVSHLVQQVDPGAVARGGSIEKMVMHGVNRVLSMQTTQGGFGYWPGATHPSAWATAYATHMLMDARDQGYNVPQGRIESAIAWLSSNVSSNNHRYASAYIHYVMAVGGKGNQGQIRREIQNLSTRNAPHDVENAYLLKAALYLAGDRSFEADLKSPGALAVTTARDTNSYSFYSDRRRRGMILNVFYDLFGNDAAGEHIADAVARDLSANSRSRYFTTQELVWGITGLGKWYRKSANATAQATLVANNRPIKAVKQKGRGDMNWAMTRASEYQDLHIDFSKQEGDLYLVMSSEGVREEPSVKYGGEGLKVSREYLTAAGEPIIDGRHKLGDLIYVRLKLTNTSGKSLQNLALVDRLPAGWEIENPSLGRDILPNWASSVRPWAADHANIRDDRLETFGSLGSGQTAEVIYVARATLAGKFHVPTIEAEAMYDPDVWARGQWGSVEIEGPWSELVD